MSGIHPINKKPDLMSNRTPEQSATLVEQTITEINTKGKSIKDKTKKGKPKFDRLITRTCQKYQINETHIHRVMRGGRKNKFITKTKIKWHTRPRRVKLKQES